VLSELHLTLLADRRATANLSFLRKLLDGLIDAPTLLSSINFQVPQRSLRSYTTFSIPNCSTNYCRNNHMYHMMRIANGQPSFLIQTNLIFIIVIYCSIKLEFFLFKCNYILNVLMYCNWALAEMV